MAFWDRFRTNNEIREEQIVPPVDDVLLRALLNSETITREKALTLPVVAGAVDFISNAVACMPVRLFKVVDDKVEEVKDDSRSKLLNGDTGDTLDAFQMKKAMVTDYLMGKGGYCYIRKNRNKVTGLFYVQDMYVEVMILPEPIYKDYQILIMGKAYKPFEFIKLLRNTKDGASGTGLTEEISKELETAYQTLLYQLGMVKSGGNKRGFLKTDRKLGQDEIDVLKTAWRNMYGNNTESVVVLNNGLQFQEASSSSVEMQMNESKRTLADEINGLFHIYPNDFERTFKEAIYPVIKAFETALNRDLLLEREKADHFFEFDVKEIVKASLNERYSAYKTAKETGFMTLNEIRRAENLNWIEGLDVVNVGLGAVLYDVDEKKYFTPNTGEATDIQSATQKKTEDMIEAHEEVEAFDESGNSAERELRENPNHDPKTGRFTTGSDTSYQGNGGYRKASGTGNTVDMMANRLEKLPQKTLEDFSEAVEVINSVKGKPDAEVNIYRATVGDSINDGDYVWLDKKHADRWTKTAMGTPKPNVKVLTMAVKASEVDWTGKNLEFVYQKENKRPVIEQRPEQRFNPNHDAKTGRFTTGEGKSGSGGSYQKADANTQAKHNRSIKRLESDEYESGTYDLRSLDQVNYNNGYQVTFSQIGDKYTPEEYAEKVNEFLEASSDGITSAGKFGGTPEVSFHVADRSVAEELARKYNQISIWDWENEIDIVTGGTGERKT